MLDDYLCFGCSDGIAQVLFIQTIVLMAVQELNNKIKVYRAMRNISQEELAIAIGVTRKTINTIETGKFVPSTIIALKIARYFKVSVEDIFELNDGRGE